MRALEVIARDGYRGASIKAIAEAVQLSQAGLLHYFDSKEELFTEILRKRDELDQARVVPDTAPAPDTLEGMRDGFLDLIRRNSEMPGVVHLFSQVSVDAVDPTHPAHDFIVQRGRYLRSMFGSVLSRSQQQGTLTDKIDSATLARVIQAVADGLQLQWMVEPDLDMAATISELFRALATVDAPSALPGRDDEHDGTRGRPRRSRSSGSSGGRRSSR